MHQGTVTTNGILNFAEHDGTHLEQVEHLIKRLEAQQHKEDGSCPGTPSRSLTPPQHHDFWREMSPQLSYIDGSSVSSVGPSYGRSVSWNLAELEGSPRAPHSLDPLDKGAPLPSLTPLARHASDSLCSPSGQCRLDVPRPFGFSSNPDPPERLSPQLAVVRVQKSAVKTKIHKRLSFGDTLDLQTTIYTPAEDAGRNYQNALTNGSNNSLEKGLSDEEQTYQGPPLVRRKSFDTQSQISYYMDKDLRYYFQHPWFRIIVAYLVIFCNFLLFAEDPVSHSHAGERHIITICLPFSFQFLFFKTRQQKRVRSHVKMISARVLQAVESCVVLLYAYIYYESLSILP